MDTKPYLARRNLATFGRICSFVERFRVLVCGKGFSTDLYRGREEPQYFCSPVTCLGQAINIPDIQYLFISHFYLLKNSFSFYPEVG